MSKIHIWLWLDSSRSLQSVFSWGPRPYPLKLMGNFPVKSRIWLFLSFYQSLVMTSTFTQKTWDMLNLRYLTQNIIVFFWRACTYCWDKPFLGDWQKVIKPCSVQELHWGVLLRKSQFLEQCAVRSFWCLVRSTSELKQTSVDIWLDQKNGCCC